MQPGYFKEPEDLLFLFKLFKANLVLLWCFGLAGNACYSKGIPLKKDVKSQTVLRTALPD